VAAAPSGTTASTTAGAVSDVPPPSAQTADVTDLNGQHVHGVKAQDVAAESQPDQPLDAPTRALPPASRCRFRPTPT
jgi:hypothetical protein